MANIDGSSSEERGTIAPVIQATSLTESVYTYLRKLIVSGAAAPGHLLRLNDLATELGVSTTPVRIALERLAADGFVVQENRRTCKVAPLSERDFKDIYLVRRCLEGTAARLGVQQITDADLARMRECTQYLSEIVANREPDVDLYLRTEWKMHVICYHAGDCPRLLREILAFRRQAERYFRIVLTQAESISDDLVDQQGFYQACEARDATLAESMAVRMLDWTVERLSPLLAQIDQPQEKARKMPSLVTSSLS